MDVALRLAGHLEDALGPPEHESRQGGEEPVGDGGFPADAGAVLQEDWYGERPDREWSGPLGFGGSPDATEAGERRTAILKPLRDQAPRARLAPEPGLSVGPGLSGA